MAGDKYRPANGVEFAFSPELVAGMHDREDEFLSSDRDLDLSGLRPVHSVKVVRHVESRRGKHVFTTTTTHTIISNRPINTNTNTNQEESKS